MASVCMCVCVWGGGGGAGNTATCTLFKPPLILEALINV